MPSIRYIETSTSAGVQSIMSIKTKIYAGEEQQ